MTIFESNEYVSIKNEACSCFKLLISLTCHHSFFVGPLVLNNRSSSSHLTMRAALLFTLLVILAEILGLVLVALMVVLTSKYFGGYAWDGSEKQFNLHPILMTAGFLFFYGNCEYQQEGLCLWESMFFTFLLDYRLKQSNKQSQLQHHEVFIHLTFTINFHLSFISGNEFVV